MEVSPVFNEKKTDQQFYTFTFIFHSLHVVCSITNQVVEHNYRGGLYKMSIQTNMSQFLREVHIFLNI